MNPANAPRVFGNRAVPASSELHRIKRLPRRRWEPSLVQHITAEMTRALKTPDGKMSLWPIQAQALHDLGIHKGLFASVPVGGGKTLLSSLAPCVLDAKRPVLLVPAGLVKKTEKERRELAKDWKICRTLRIISYEELGRVSGADKLTHWRPDLIIADEAHRLKNPKAAVTRRVKRYMQEHSETIFVAMSGTMMSHGLHDFAHLLRWCLKERAPIPRTEGELQEWADALDDKVNFLQRVAPGALLELADDVEAEDELARARIGFRRRLTETEGVITSDGHEDIGASLYVSALQYDTAPIVEQHFETLRTLWQTPDGWDLMEAVDVWRHARELAIGMHYAWSPRPPKEWLSARKEWASFVRQTLSKSRTLDSEKQVADACLAGEMDRSAFDIWQAIKKTFTPNVVPVWHDDSALKVCAEWMKKPGIVWTEHSFFGRELSRRTGVPYYGEGGLDSQGNRIEDADPKKSAIASRPANCTGRNLQKIWNRNLITTLPSLALQLEQLIGRTHRSGQPEDEVIVDVLLGCWEHFDAWQKALSGAEAASQLLGHTHKLLLADTDFPSESEVRALGGFRWGK